MGALMLIVPLLGGTLGAVFTRDGTDWQQCHCSTGFGDNGCTTGTCTLVNRFTGAFRCEDASGDPHWSSCQDIRWVWRRL